MQLIIISDIEAQVVSDGETLSNYEFLVSIGNSLIEKVVKKSGLPDEKVNISLAAVRQDSLNGFVEKRLSSYLINLGYDIYTNPVDSLKAVHCNDYLIRFNTIDIGIRYKADFNKDASLRRTGFLTVDFKITECASNRILLNDIYAESATDWINSDEKESLENQKMQFTMGNVETDSQAIRFKPLIITAVTGTIVYLFYSLRSR